ncbi:sensor domain-containing diguanylate cyclase [Vibrio barjaei]|jgi:diguanylate cyclase (GGDEF)-like protein|uniref:sensor domain-containing diguanylate cyclase n=1 Tax=Vibrio barjaei TaxID=1676683 RepID=UPI0007BBF4B0|nr:sensor domain-containing diguanylate cyclase [Vibrio barjaei]OIN24256.1 diguanylate cyclase [Vibrio barjaei]
MQPAPIPINDDYRLSVLQTLKLLATPEERFDRVTRLAKRMFSVDISMVSIVERDRQWFKSCVGLDATETARDISFCGHAILGDEPFIISDALSDERFSDNPLVISKPNIRFYAGVPIKLADNVKVGTLCIIDSKPRHFSDQEVQDLIDLAKLAEDELIASLDSTIDELTQISNRRGFNILADKVINRCRFAMEPYTMASFDLNHFKLINDTYGHGQGDAALVIFARLLVENFRDSDVIARIGGDEFVVLMSGTTGLDAKFPLTRFKDQITMFNNSSDSEFELSYSVGVVCFSPLEKLSHSDLLAKADLAMYASKQAN